jgi:hypothetical protein
VEFFIKLHILSDQAHQNLKSWERPVYQNHMILPIAGCAIESMGIQASYRQYNYLIDLDEFENHPLETVHSIVNQVNGFKKELESILEEMLFIKTIPDPNISATHWVTERIQNNLLSFKEEEKKLHLLLKKINQLRTVINYIYWETNTQNAHELDKLNELNALNKTLSNSIKRILCNAKFVIDSDANKMDSPWVKNLLFMQMFVTLRKAVDMNEKKSLSTKPLVEHTDLIDICMLDFLLYFMFYLILLMSILAGFSFIILLVFTIIEIVN